MIPPHFFYQIYLSFLEQNDCTPPKCGELSEYILTVLYTKVCHVTVVQSLHPLWLPSRVAHFEQLGHVAINKPKDDAYKRTLVAI